MKYKCHLCGKEWTDDNNVFKTIKACPFCSSSFYFENVNIDTLKDAFKYVLLKYWDDKSPTIKLYYCINDVIGGFNNEKKLIRRLCNNGVYNKILSANENQFRYVNTETINYLIENEFLNQAIAKSAVDWLYLAIREYKSEKIYAKRYEKAYEMYKLGQYEEAFEVFNELASRGHLESQYRVGVCYDRGRGVKKNYEFDLKWYKKAAEKGNHIDAQINLANIFYEQQKYAEAIKYFKLASNSGDYLAKENLARIYLFGHGNFSSFQEAKIEILSLLEESYKLGNTEAKSLIQIVNNLNNYVSE